MPWSELKARIAAERAPREAHRLAQRVRSRHQMRRMLKLACVLFVGLPILMFLILTFLHVSLSGHMARTVGVNWGVTRFGGVNWEEVTRFIPGVASICFFLAVGSVSFLAFDKPKRITLANDGFTVRTLGARDYDLIRWEWVKRAKLADGRDFMGNRYYSISLLTTLGVEVAFRWRDLVASMPPANFFNALRTWAPDAVSMLQIPSELLTAQAIGIPTDSQGNSGYTELWLKYFSPPTKRERTEDLGAGTRLCHGRFEVVGRIGGGGQGNTYLALNRQGANQDVVLKEYILPVHRGTAVMRQVEEKLQNEVKILSNIDHPQVVKLLDSFTEDYRGYLVLEYVEGKSLKDIVTLQGPRTEQFVIDVARQLCDVLGYVHGLSPPVVHRDVTPENIMLQLSNQVKLVDFNVAQQLESVATATIVGKHAYLPPEQFRGKPTKQSDIYALGCTMFFLLTGQDPEPISTSHPRELNAEVSEKLDTIIARATNPDMENRYPTIAHMAADLMLLS
jgi:tRNA A-37 threonylcarbamoyl transferase component Bud32